MCLQPCIEPLAAIHLLLQLCQVVARGPRAASPLPEAMKFLGLPRNDRCLHLTDDREESMSYAALCGFASLCENATRSSKLSYFESESPASSKLTWENSSPSTISGASTSAGRGSLTSLTSEKSEASPIEGEISTQNMTTSSGVWSDLREALPKASNTCVPTVSDVLIMGKISCSMTAVSIVSDPCKGRKIRDDCPGMPQACWPV